MPDPVEGTVVLPGQALGRVGPVQPRQPYQPLPRPDFAGFRFPPEATLLAVRRYLRYGLSYWDVEELLAERGSTADHVTIYRWV